MEDVRHVYHVLLRKIWHSLATSNFCLRKLKGDNVYFFFEERNFTMHYQIIYALLPGIGTKVSS